MARTTVYQVLNPRDIPAGVPILRVREKPFYVGAMLRGGELPADVRDRLEQQGFIKAVQESASEAAEETEG